MPFAADLPPQLQERVVCAVSAASVIVENVVAMEVARALIDKFGGDSVTEMQSRWELFQQLARER